MHTEISTFEAKNRLSELLRRVERGEKFLITRRGEIVAELGAPEKPPTAEEKNAWQRLRDLKKRSPIGTPEEIAEWKAEGRR